MLLYKYIRPSLSYFRLMHYILSIREWPKV